jgi:hypothetical protein
MQNIGNSDEVSLCHKDNSIHASGTNGKLLIGAVCTLLMMWGISIVAKARF